MSDDNMVIEWLRIADIAEQTGIPESTIRRYASLFDDYLEYRTIGRAKKYSAVMVEVFQQVANLYRDGFSTDEVKLVLEHDCPTSAEVATTTTTEPPQANIPDVVKVTSLFMEYIKNQDARLRDQEDRIVELEQRLKNFETKKSWWQFWKKM